MPKCWQPILIIDNCLNALCRRYKIRIHSTESHYANITDNSTIVCLFVEGFSPQRRPRSRYFASQLASSFPFSFSFSSTINSFSISLPFPCRSRRIFALLFHATPSRFIHFRYNLWQIVDNMTGINIFIFRLRCVFSAMVRA